MEAILSRLRGLTADELRDEFARTDLKCGPITATTRAIFERKLARALLGEEGTVSETDAAGTGSGAPGAKDAHQGECATPALPKHQADEVDFGYGLGLNPPEEEALSEKSRASCSGGVEEVISHFKGQTPSKASEVSPLVFYGVCPLWEDVLTRNERVQVYADKKEALQAVKMMKGARFKAFTNREDAEKFAKGMCDYFPSPNKSTVSLSPGKPCMVFCKDNAPVLEVDAINRERANSFKSPRTQDLTAKLRKAVEKGDEGAFNELVWSNPRYLIGSGDNPTVVQEGCRYNVMHVAAKENQPGIAQLLLDTLENPEFMRLMYPDDQDAMLQKRIRYIVDLYLNTPDKAAFETPLHFACKFGCPEVVNVLCSHPDTDKNCKNKYDQKPSDVICERKNKTPEIKQKIIDYLEDRFYIPLLRATDNTLQPVIGAPWSPEPSESLPHSLEPRLTRSPMDPVMAVRAYVGPLSPSKADEFRRVWKTPPRDRTGHFYHILKSDLERGAERVGRNLAHEMGHPWKEYWDFLDAFIDLSTPEGLRKLEEFLNKKDFRERTHEETGENETSSRFRTPSPGKPKKFCNSISVGAFLDESDDISLEEMKNRQNAALTSITAVCAKDSLEGAVGGLEFHILPVSHGADLIETAAEQDLLRSSKSLLSSASKNGLCPSTGGERTPNGDKSFPRSSSSCHLSPISNLMVEFERMSLQDPADSQSRRSGGHRSRDDCNPHMADLASGVARLGVATKEELVLEKGRSASRAGGLWKTCDGVDGEAEDEFSTSSDEYYGPVESLEAGTQRTKEPVSERNVCARSKSWDHGGRVLSLSGSSSSYKSADSQDLILRTPPRVRKSLFIEGDSPTKLDREVLSAIEAIDIDPLKYPSIHKWKSTIQSYTTSEMQSWQSPAGLQSFPRVQSFSPGSPLSSPAFQAGRFSPARHTSSSDFSSPSRYSPAHGSHLQRGRLLNFSGS